MLKIGYVSNYHSSINNKLSFKNNSIDVNKTEPKLAAPSKDSFSSTYGFDYELDEIEEEKKKKRNKIIGLCIATGALIAGGIIFYKKGGMSWFKNKKQIDTFEFHSLKDDIEVPTLETCKSIDGTLKDFLEKQIMFAKATPEELKRVGSPADTNKLLLYGEPGSGKSFFAKIFAKTIGADYKEITYSDLNDRFCGHHIENIKSEFENIIELGVKNPNKKYVVTFNEIDAFAQPLDKLANGAGYSTFKQDERSGILNHFEKLFKLCPNVIVVGTTNAKPTAKTFDGALLSRFENSMKVEYPNKYCLTEALKDRILTVEDGAEFISKNQKEIETFVDSMDKRKCSYRNLNNVVNKSKTYYLLDYQKDKSAKYKIEYLEKALKSVGTTDGEASGIVKGAK